MSRSDPSVWSSVAPLPPFVWVPPPGWSGWVVPTGWVRRRVRACARVGFRAGRSAEGAWTITVLYESDAILGTSRYGPSDLRRWTREARVRLLAKSEDRRCFDRAFSHAYRLFCPSVCLGPHCTWDEWETNPAGCLFHPSSQSVNASPSGGETPLLDNPPSYRGDPR